MVVFAFVNHKGGVGKTSSALFLANYLALNNHKILAIDLDPQANFSLASNSQPNLMGSFDLLARGASINDCIQIISPFYHLISADAELSAADEFISPSKSMDKRAVLLKNALKKVDGEYDFVIIDTPPHLRILVANALAAANKVIIPAAADVFSSNGLIQLLNFIDDIKAAVNPSLIVDGILLTRYKSNSNFSKKMLEIYEEIAKKSHTRLYKSQIRESVKVSEATALQLPLLTYLGGGTKVCKDYLDFVNEVFEVDNNGKAEKL